MDVSESCGGQWRRSYGATTHRPRRQFKLTRPTTSSSFSQKKWSPFAQALLTVDHLRRSVLSNRQWRNLLWFAPKTTSGEPSWHRRRSPGRWIQSLRSFLLKETLDPLLPYVTAMKMKVSPIVWYQRAPDGTDIKSASTTLAYMEPSAELFVLVDGISPASAVVELSSYCIRITTKIWSAVATTSHYSDKFRWNSSRTFSGYFVLSV